MREIVRGRRREGKRGRREDVPVRSISFASSRLTREAREDELDEA
jgi:hypothetical protein